MCQQWQYYLRCAGEHEGYSVYHTTFCPEIIKGVHCLTSCAQEPTQRYRMVESEDCPGCIYSEASKKGPVLVNLGKLRDAARTKTSDLLRAAQVLATRFDDVALRLHFQSEDRKRKNATQKKDEARRTLLLNDMRDAVHALEHHNAYTAAIDLALIVARTQLIPLSWGGSDTSHWFENPNLTRIEPIPQISCPEWYPRIYRSPKINALSISSADEQAGSSSSFAGGELNSTRAAEAADLPSELPCPLDIAHGHAERYNIDLRARTLRRVASRDGFSTASLQLYSDRRANSSKFSLTGSLPDNPNGDVDVDEAEGGAKGSRASSRACRDRRRRRISREMALARSRSRSRETMSSDRSVRSEVDPAEVRVPLSPDGRL